MAVPPLDPKIWPPERGFPPDAAGGGSTGATVAPPLSTFERIIRYAERDDLLLYATALFGVFMPVIMYFVYRAAHTQWQAYSKRQREKQRRVRCRERTVTMFYASADRALKKFTYALAELLVGVDAAVVALVLENLSMFFNYKGIAVFILPDIDPEAENEMRFETRERSLLAGMRFAIFAIAAPDDQQQAPSEQPSEKRSGGASEIAALLSKRLVALEACELQPPILIANNKAELELQPKLQADHLNVALKTMLNDANCGYNSDETELLTTEESELSDDDESANKKVN